MFLEKFFFVFHCPLSRLGLGMMLFLEFSNTRSGEEMRSVHRRDFQHGRTSSGLGYVVHRFKFWKHGKNLLKVSLFFVLVCFEFFLFIQTGGKLAQRESLFLHEPGSGEYDFVVWFNEYLGKLPKDFGQDAKSFWQRTLDAYKMVCFFFGLEVFLCIFLEGRKDGGVQPPTNWSEFFYRDLAKVLPSTGCSLQGMLGSFKTFYF